MLSLTAFTLALAGLTCVALAMPRHARRVGIEPPRWGRTGGACLLALSLIVRTAATDWQVGLVEWTGQLTLASALVLLGLHIHHQNSVTR